MGGVVKSVGNVLKGLPVVGDVAHLIDRPGDILKNPLGTLGPLALNFGMIPGASGLLGSGFADFMKSPWGKYVLPAVAGGSALGGSSGLPGFLNNITNSMGFKLGPGGPYQDAGLGDRQLEVADIFKDTGKNLLQQGDSLPDWRNMGALGNVGQIMSDMANMTGVRNPIDGSVPFGVDASNPYALTGPQKTQLAMNVDEQNQARDRMLSGKRHELALNGITDPRAMAAYEARVRSGTSGNVAAARAGAEQTAFGNRMQTLSSFTPVMERLFGAQQGQQNNALNFGANFLGNAGSFYGQGANRAIGMRQNADNSLGSLVGLFGGSAFGAGQQGSNPIQDFVTHLLNPNTWKRPSAPKPGLTPWNPNSPAPVPQWGAHPGPILPHDGQTANINLPGKQNNNDTPWWDAWKPSPALNMGFAT